MTNTIMAILKTALSQPRTPSSVNTASEDVVCKKVKVHRRTEAERNNPIYIAKKKQAHKR